MHKKTYTVTAICEKEIVKRDTLAAYPEQLIKYIKKYFKGGKIYTAYEAGFSGSRIFFQKKKLFFWKNSGMTREKIDRILVEAYARLLGSRVKAV